MKAIIFAAGLGSRLKPWTDQHPKALAPVNGKSLLERNVLYLQQFGIRELIVNVHHFADQIVQAITDSHGWGSTITISDETDQVLETGGGLQKAGWYFKEETDFVVMNVDILTNLNLGDMIAAHQRSACLATLAVTERSTSRYFLFNPKGELCGWRNVQTGEEKPAELASHPDYAALQQKAFSGIHVINNSIFSMMLQQGKFSMVEVYLDLMQNNSIQCFDHSQSKFIDVGKPESVAKAEALFI
jgi:N-acetyl-alpha-D-muramate 1-phosphate uridylyltransferase